MSSHFRFSPKLSLGLILLAMPLLLVLVKPAFSNRAFSNPTPDSEVDAHLVAQADYYEEAPLESGELESGDGESLEYDDPSAYTVDPEPTYDEWDTAPVEDYSDYSDPYADDAAPAEAVESGYDDPSTYPDSGYTESEDSEPEYNDPGYPESGYVQPDPTAPAGYAEPTEPVEAEGYNNSTEPFSNSFIEPIAPANASTSPKPTANQPSPVPSPLPTAVSPNAPASPAPADPIASCPEANLAATNTPLVEGMVHRSNVVSVVETALTQLAPALSARPFPEIHGQARMARVPVIMYHDILPEKEVFFDVTPDELEADFQLIKQKGLTPITLDQLVEHLSTGKPLPEKPILLTFDDGYQGHYTYVYQLMQKYGYPAVFAIYPKKVGTHYGRSSLTWEQLRQMADDPLVTIASHSITHPSDLRELPDAALRREVVESKRILETQLGIPIDHFVYPEGKYDARVAHWVKLAGYHSALTMNDEEDRFAGQSIDLLSIDRIGQSGLENVVDQAYGGPPLSAFGNSFNFNNPVELHRLTVEDVPLIFATGGRPTTVHADSRYQVWEIMKKTDAVAAVDGGFFSLELLTSNDMIGPVLSHNNGQFIPASHAENAGIKGRPLVLISPNTVKFIPYDPAKHNTFEGIRAEMPDVTDAFVAAAWLVKDSQPQPRESFGTLFDFDAARDRAFWGIDQAGQPVVGVSGDYVDSITFGEALSQAGLRDAVMLDSGASASLAYQGQSMMSYDPRPVPHVVALLPSQTATATPCAVVSQNQTEGGATGTN